MGGETYVEYTVLDEMKLGQAARRNWRVLVLGERELGQDHALLLGYDFFQQVDIEFDLSNDTVRLFQAEDCGNVSLAYWARGTADVVSLAIDNEKPGILVPVKLNDRALLAELDSGASRSVVSRLVAAQIGVGIASYVNIFNPQVVIVGGGAIAAGELLLAPARDMAARRALPRVWEGVRVVPARFGAESGMLGAAALAMEGLDGAG